MIFVLMGMLQASAGEHEVIVSAKGQEIEMSKREIKQLFTRQTMKWTDDQELTVVLPLIESAAMLWLSKNILGLPPEIYHRYLLEKAYRAGESPPAFVATPTLLNGEVVLTVAKEGDFSSEDYSIIRIR